MPANNRNQSSRQRMPTNLEGRYGKIGISAVEAAARYSSDRKRTQRSIKDAGRDHSQQRTTEATEGLILNSRPSDSPRKSVTGRSSLSEVRHYDGPDELYRNRPQLSRV